MDHLVRIAAILGILFAAPLSTAPAPSGSQSSCTAPGQSPLSISLDGVALQGCLPFPPGSAWALPHSREELQTAYTLGDGAGFAVTAIPFGSSAPTEVFPRVDSLTSEARLFDVLRSARERQGAQVVSGPTATLFGRPAESLVSTLVLPGAGSGGAKTRLTEWLVLRGQRLWIFRAIQSAAQPPLATAGGLEVTSPHPDAPSTSAAALRQRAGIQSILPALAVPQAAADSSWNLPTPPWWKGTCDKDRYTGSYPLGSSFRNVLTCGPLPGMGYWDWLTYFYPGAFPVYEWECVELVLRFMYQAYGVPPYAANGNGIVSNYGGSEMARVNNGVKGQAPVPGDVLSYCAWCTYGHTTVVTDTDIDSSGSGTVTVMEENWTVNGQSTLVVSNWWVYGGTAGPVYAWLHPKVSVPSPTPTPRCTATPTPTFTPVPSETPTPLPNQFFFPIISGSAPDPCA